MKKIILIVFGLGIVLGIKAQNYSQILIGHNWQVVSLSIEGELFVDADNTCMYSTVISFVDEANLTLAGSCRSTSSANFELSNDLLIVENPINGNDTLTITEITENSFSTLLLKRPILNDSIILEPVNIITSYEKL
ncbi:MULTISPECIES: hypothetical protein [unclassified Lentimicrobium]|uniref:hypothetical protein n=1 Tax=unclassified Lentimicrobium TaxID=2677434 RepID=UPI0015517553|nr:MULTISPECIES: hypothetical protein [unclassified Lentimicrobium]NPD48224.1 hypothetical protein [Lentimicrobium sp. S6]NPD86914.1 hypothetical protein [Lentimicrobium sp. L6]